jgi:large subunit ribosomal protein L10
MARPDKVAAVSELSEKFTSSAGIVLTEYRGLSVKALKELRRSLGDNATYAVSKNTLTTIAAREAGVPGIEAHLVGPTAIAFVQGDPVAVAKGLRDFARTNPQLVIKGGVLDGKFLEPEEVRKLADLESREALLAKVAGGMKGILQQAISLISAPLSQTARLLAALEEAAKENPALIGGAGEPSSADAAEPSNAGLAAAEDTAEPTNAELAAEDAQVSEPSNEELAAAAATDDVLAAAAAGTEPAATAATPEVTVAPGDSTTAPAAEDN